MFGFGTHRAAVRNRAALLPDREPSVRDLLIASDAALAVYAPSIAASASRPEGGAPTLASDKVGTLANLKGGGWDLRSPSPSQAPQWRSGALLFDGSDDLLAADFPSGAQVANLALFAIYKGADAKGILFAGSLGGHGLGIYDSADAGSSIFSYCGAPTIAIDGTTVADSRAALSTALSTGTARRIEVRHANLTSWGRFGLGNSALGGWKVGGKLIPLAILDENHPDFAEALMTARAYADEQIDRLAL